jgi:hypothetical protein
MNNVRILNAASTTGRGSLWTRGGIRGYVEGGAYAWK